MATQQDLQDLLRLLTVGRKTPMMQAMTQIKALQAADLRSITQIAEAPLATVQAALKDDKSAKLLQNACKAALKRAASTPAPNAGDKRGAPDPATSQAKRVRTDLFRNGPVEMTPQELERSLELPLCMDEACISTTVIETNRAPLVLAFAVEVLRHTMPAQPLSSRLSLGQAVVSANSRSKAASLGLSKGPSADEEGWGEGHPRVKVMGREVAVLKRSGYEWREEETAVGQPGNSTTSASPDTQPQATSTQLPDTQAQTTSPPPTPKTTWTASPPLTLKSSTFLAHTHPLTSPLQRAPLMQHLLSTRPHLATATHNAWAYRLRAPEGSIANKAREASHDDGETGAGDLILRAMRDVGAVDTLVVLTRWFGGTMLGADRWRLMRECVGAALGERLRRRGMDDNIGGEAVWGLDLEAERGVRGGAVGAGAGAGAGAAAGVGGLRVHRPEAARGYLLRSFGTGDGKGKSPRKARPRTVVEAEKEENLGLLLGALRIVFDSWADHLSAAELDRRAWSWYAAVRPNVESGQAGWGAKGLVKLSDVLRLQRAAQK
ncbi:hypothetical protein BT67DRAFT_171407 [Trichocladium antarcticum]|uniref:Impact N-terminal domain-containing protein n=1 Tax=Trichocladium antarcticum TaxID=1450529 RepID=A0AAN6UE41_9PEZI|nr:hypothetical protein BT67DRAFT_171407 [Trichocladium antarcticum]